jgi:hypothetical protein
MFWKYGVYIIFGSADSIDRDVLIVHPDAAGTEHDIELVNL